MELGPHTRRIALAYAAALGGVCWAASVLLTPSPDVFDLGTAGVDVWMLCLVPLTFCAGAQYNGKLARIDRGLFHGTIAGWALIIVFRTWAGMTVAASDDEAGIHALWSGSWAGVALSAAGSAGLAIAVGWRARQSMTEASAAATAYVAALVMGALALCALPFYTGDTWKRLPSIAALACPMALAAAMSVRAGSERRIVLAAVGSLVSIAPVYWFCARDAVALWSNTSPACRAGVHWLRLIRSPFWPPSAPVC